MHSLWTKKKDHNKSLVVALEAIIYGAQKDRIVVSMFESDSGFYFEYAYDAIGPSCFTNLPNSNTVQTHWEKYLQ